jgi:hypothetical protein
LSSHWFRAVPGALVAQRVWPVSVVLALAGLGFACGSVKSNASSVPVDAGGDAAFGSGASEGDAGAASSCRASGVATYVQGSYQPAAAPSGACLGADGGGLWEGFYDACLGPAKSMDACTQYKQAPSNAACAACILTPSVADTLGPILDFGTFVSGNVAGCIEVTAPGDLSCPKAVQALSDCEAAACEANCPVSDAASLEAREQCAQDADAAGCRSFFEMASMCQAADADAGLAGACTNSGFKDFFDDVVPLFCAQAGEDASAPIDAEAPDGGAAHAFADAGEFGDATTD